MGLGLLSEPLVLPCGLRVPNRLCRAAMTEGLADSRNDPTKRHERLYAAAAAGGAGLVLTGNAMVDRQHLERARAIVIDGATDAGKLRAWAASCEGAPTLVQLSHPGRQVTRFVQPAPVAASAGPAVSLGPGARIFAAPRALTTEEVREVARRFVDASRRVLDAGFAGVEVHAAHGYLLSGFLDPAHNRRDDGYGVGLAGRGRLLLEIVEGMRHALPARAAIAVKLDARAGMEDELAELGLSLERAGADLLEVSGGNYESAAMLGLDRDGNALAAEHESPFWAAAERLTAATRVPVMLTGGFRTRDEAERALALGVAAMIGVARPLAIWPALAGRLVRGEADSLPRPAPRLGGPRVVRRVAGAAAGSGWHRQQLARTGAGKRPRMWLPAWLAALDYVVPDALWALRWRRARMRLAHGLAPPAPTASGRFEALAPGARRAAVASGYAPAGPGEPRCSASHAAISLETSVSSTST